MGICHSTIKTRTGLSMSRKLEQYSEPSSPYLALNAVAQFIQTIAGTWDTCSHSQKAEILEATARVTASVTEVLAENLERSKPISERNN